MMSCARLIRQVQGRGEEVAVRRSTRLPPLAYWQWERGERERVINRQDMLIAKAG